jgi:uncharacterized protein with HEPN domain
MRRDDALLLDMLVAARKIARFVQGLTEQEFQSSELVQSGVMRELQVLGDACRMISDETRARHEDIPWTAIAGMRHRIVHEYFDIRLDVVWETVTKSIPPLLAVLERIVAPEE